MPGIDAVVAKAKPGQLTGIALMTLEKRSQLRCRLLTLAVAAAIQLSGVLPTIGPNPALAAGTVVPIIFPVLGSSSYTASFGAPRAGHTHEGVDILASKMTPAVAVVGGRVDWLNDGSEGSSYYLLLRGDDGNDYFYVHLNNDTPGTDDGNGGPARAYAAGLKNGDYVYPGQLIAYVGDSGNAEGTSPHLHFEIHLGGYRNPIDPYPSLQSAVRPTLFKDTYSTLWYFSYVAGLARAGILGGYPDGFFWPYRSITRAQLAKVLVLAKGVPANRNYRGYFPDVPVTHWAWSYVETAKDLGVVSGYAWGDFRPDAPVSRVELAAMLYRLGGFAPQTTGPTFSDVPSGYWGFVPIMTIRNRGLVSGYPDGTFRPAQHALRAETAKTVSFLSQALAQ